MNDKLTGASANEEAAKEEIAPKEGFSAEKVAEVADGKFDENLEEIRERTQKELEKEKAQQDKDESEEDEPEPKKKITRKVIVRSVSPEVQKMEDDKYVLEQAMNCFPNQETFTYQELQKLFNNGEIQVTIRR